MKASNYSLIENLRHELHQHPELSYEEVWTKQHLMDFLTEHTSLELHDGGKYFYAVYRAENRSGGRKPVAFRADFDALPIDVYKRQAQRHRVFRQQYGRHHYRSAAPSVPDPGTKGRGRYDGGETAQRCGQRSRAQGDTESSGTVRKRSGGKEAGRRGSGNLPGEPLQQDQVIGSKKLILKL